jgi:hypothetical protein
VIKTPCGVIVVKALLSATDDVMRDHVEISDRLTGAELLLYMLVMFLMLTLETGAWRTMAYPFVDGLIIICRDARSARGGPL